MLADTDVSRVLMVTAHPDDVDFGAAGTVARWTAEGVAVSYCVVTDGDAGGFDDRVPRAEMPALRRSEQRAAAAVVGVTDVSFLGYPDGRLMPTIELRRDISRVIREVRPHRVVCQSPQRMWGRIFASHPDHLAAGEAALCAVYPDARNPFAHPELLRDGFEPWSVDHVWLMAHDTPNRWVDVTDTVEAKGAAVACHRSQFPDGAEWAATAMRLAAEDAGRTAGVPCAEGFRRLRLGG